MFEVTTFSTKHIFDEMSCIDSVQATKGFSNRCVSKIELDAHLVLHNRGTYMYTICGYSQ